MKEKTTGDVYYTMGEYVSRYNHGNLDMSIDSANDIKVLAQEIALSQSVPIKTKSGSGPSEKRKTMTLPKHIWDEAFKQLEL